YEILKKHFSHNEAVKVMEYFGLNSQDSLSLEPEVSEIFKKLFSEEETAMLMEYCRNAKLK
ncbi:MAG: hypothetical protein JWQ09_3037, partial [Segetibacter sp.]|nr:hypothetical protein [Segetibacter sp.]